ncbi:hypothetical protein AVEN_22839-1 [Araneus ventricosus]|uniref:Uncharacterized protein n=1 Tax=Araneus ventricosus TaxID=182803 RepID=A0A4Y2L8L1_ARAVE|nr:hypothetical protein AVEN_22839-1 [Araneus ventricosus]
MILNLCMSLHCLSVLKCFQMSTLTEVQKPSYNLRVPSFCFLLVFLAKILEINFYVLEVSISDLRGFKASAAAKLLLNEVTLKKIVNDTNSSPVTGYKDYWRVEQHAPQPVS